MDEYQLGCFHLELMFRRADRIDIGEGLCAYPRYHGLMSDIAQEYGAPLDRVVAAFCALSPNNDYNGNLRSLVSCLDALRAGDDFDHVQISTYRHCGERAWKYLTGEALFLDQVKGQKIINFYHNVLRPDDNRYVTIDGHMVAAWRNQNLTMKEAIIRTRREYEEVAGGCKANAFMHYMKPSQYQAIIWFARKRSLGIKYDAQLGLFTPPTDVWRSSRDVQEIKPFARRTLRFSKPLNSAPVEGPYQWPIWGPE